MPVGLPVSDAGLGGLSSRTGLDGVGAVSVGEWGKQTERGRDTRDVSWCGVMLGMYSRLYTAVGKVARTLDQRSSSPRDTVTITYHCCLCQCSSRQFIIMSIPLCRVEEGGSRKPRNMENDHRCESATRRE